MNESVESMCAGNRTTLRLGRASARPRCHDIDDVGKVPIPAAVPGDFTVLMGAVVSAMASTRKSPRALGCAWSKLPPPRSSVGHHNRCAPLPPAPSAFNPGAD